MIRFYNGKTLRFDGGAHLTADEVWTDGGVIVHVGAPQKETPAFEREIDLRANAYVASFPFGQCMEWYTMSSCPRE